MTDNEKEKWTKSIEDTFRLFGYIGQVTIEDTDKHFRFLIHHSDFENPFIGEYPGVDDLFIIIITDYNYRDHNGADTKHRESIMYDGNTTAPLYYSICNGPEYQRVFIRDYMNHAKGTAVYTNSSISGGYRMQPLDEPIFKSEILNIDILICNLLG